MIMYGDQLRNMTVTIKVSHGEANIDLNGSNLCVILEKDIDEFMHQLQKVVQKYMI